MDTPIFNRLKKYVEENNISFHTPGHKGRNTLINWSQYIPWIDLTEVEGLDNLQDPNGIILESQKLASNTFKSKQTFYSVNGTTGSIYIALGAITSPGDKVLIQRNSHKAIYNGIILNRLVPRYIYPNYNKKNKIVTGINPHDVETILKRDKDIKAVVITYPSYYGVCSPIESIAEIVHKYNRILLVDEAHGSHLMFSEKLPKSSIEAGADIVVQSTHKTLPSFTQTSMIHVVSDRVDIEKLKDMLNLYQTTSPSYMFMASLDIARAYMEGEGTSKLRKHIESLEKVIMDLKGIDRVSIFTGDKEDFTIEDFDMTKVLVNIKGMRGTTLEKILRNKYHIQLEMSDYYYGLLLTTLMNTKKDLDLFKEAIEDMIKSEPYEDIRQIDFGMIEPTIEIPIGEAFYREKEVSEFKEAIGKISADYIIPYPPGIPIVVPGEVITYEIYQEILNLSENGVEIIGPLDYNRGKIKLVK